MQAPAPAAPRRVATVHWVLGVRSSQSSMTPGKFRGPFFAIRSRSLVGSMARTPRSRNRAAVSAASSRLRDSPLSAANRSSHHTCRESGCALRVQSGTRIIGLLVPFDSEVRKRACRKMMRTSESGHSAITAGISGHRSGVNGSSCRAAIPSRRCLTWVKRCREQAQQKSRSVSDYDEPLALRCYYHLRPAQPR